MSHERLELLKQLRLGAISDRNRIDQEIAKMDELISLYSPRQSDSFNFNFSSSNFAPEPNKNYPAAYTKTEDRKEPKAQASSLSTPGIMQIAIALVLELYDENPRFISTGTVLEELEKRGNKVGGVSPSGNVSSYLNHSDELTNFRGYGWVRTRDKKHWENWIVDMKALD